MSKTKPTLYIFCGLPFSGKTTLAKRILEKVNLEFVSIDEIKFARGFNWSEDEQVPAEIWQEIFDESYQKTLSALKSGNSVLYDSANQSKESRDKLRDIARSADANAKVIFMDIPIEVVEERWNTNQISKERFHLPKRFFRAAFSNYEPPTSDENIIRFSYGEDTGSWLESNFKSLE